MRILLVGSSGGHLTHLYALKDFWQQYDRTWVTFHKKDAQSILKGENCEWCFYPTNRNILNLIKNTFLSFNILRNEKPDLIISTGAGVAIPFFWLGKLLFRAKTVFIEVYDRIDNPTLTGKVVYPVTDLFLVQWDELLAKYPKAKNIGKIY